VNGANVNVGHGDVEHKIWGVRTQRVAPPGSAREICGKSSGSDRIVGEGGGGDEVGVTDNVKGRGAVGDDGTPDFGDTGRLVSDGDTGEARWAGSGGGNGVAEVVDAGRPVESVERPDDEEAIEVDPGRETEIGGLDGNRRGWLTPQARSRETGERADHRLS